MRHLADAMPVGAAKLVGEQLTSAASVSGKKGVGLLIALAVALFGARSAAGGVIDALNIAYEKPNRRGFVRSTIRATAITAASILLALSAAIAAAAT